MVKVTIRLYEDDLAELRAAYHGRPYNVILRALVNRHVKLIKEKTSENLHKLQQGDFSDE